MSSFFQRSGIYYGGIQVDVVVDGKSKRKQHKESLRTRNHGEGREKLRELENRLHGVKLSQLLHEWLLVKSFNPNKKSPEYINLVTDTFNNFIKYFKDKSAASITARDIRNFSSYLSAVRKNNQTTVSIKLRCIKAVLNFGENHGFINNRPFKAISIKKSDARPVFLVKEEIHKLLKAANDRPLYRYFIEFLLLTGCRSGELRKLKWENVKPHFIIFNGKTGERTFPRNKKLSKLIKKIGNLQPDDCNYVFSTENGHWLQGRSTISKLVKRYMRKAKLSEDYTAHTLRHTFCSQLVMQGEQMEIVKELAGHSTVLVTEQYVHLRPELLKVNTAYY